jgi:pectin methylesterase-like acyl-CoA thioesterase
VRASIVGAVLSAATAAQTFVVEAANGPGTSFTTLVAAVAAVPDGGLRATSPVVGLVR